MTRTLTLTLAAALVAAPAVAQKANAPEAPVPDAPAVEAGGVVYGDDLNQWANDGECDDPRFAGATMAAVLNWTTLGHDASDCRAGVEGGSLVLFDLAASRAALPAPEFGDDSGPYANDTECDDIRFWGIGMARGMDASHVMADASDCARLFEMGLIGLRDY